MTTFNQKSVWFTPLFLAVILAISSANKLQAQTCNQVEILYTSPDCLEQPPANPGGLGGRTCKEIAVCVDQVYTYSSSVTGTGWTFNWSVSGPASVTINPNNTSSTVNISWPQVGVFTLTLTATDPSGNVFTYCLKANVKDKPIANFSFTPNNVCAASTISFTNTTTYSGSVAYSWSFGDPSSGSNNYSTATNPTHTYNSAGFYTVTLVAYSFTTNGGSTPNDPPSIKICCADTITKIVRILPGNVKIDCVSTVCAGDTATYSVSGCGNPTWGPVTGGAIFNQSGNSVTIIWGNGNPQGQIQVQCANGCIASVPVPIIPTNPQIIGNTMPCTNATTSYSLPVLPGTFYTWTLTNLTTSTNHNNLISTYPDNNTAWINWSAAPPGTYQLSINLDNKHICCTSNGSILITPSVRWTAFMDQTICAGTVANLFVSPGTGTFNWTVLPPNGGVAPLTGTGPGFNPFFSNPGTYLVEVIETASTYCNSGAANPQQIKVTVLSTPAPGLITGPITVCPGSQYTYTMSTNAPPGYHYSWSITSGVGTFQPGNLATTTGDSAIIIWTGLPGTISVVLQRNENPSCPSTPVTLNVTQATAGAITGTLNVCVDGTGTYTITGGTLPAGEPVNWSISPASQGTILSGQGTNTITVLWHGTTGTGPWGPVTISASTACGSPTPLGGIMIYPKFTVSIVKSGTDICQTGGVTLTVSGAPSGATYLWSPGGQTTSFISNIIVAGTYSVTVTAGGCSFTSSYTVEDPFQIAPLSCGVGTCNGATINEVLSVIVVKPTSGSFSYQWYSGTFPSGTLILGANSPTYTALSDGNYYVVVTYGNCQKHQPFIVKKICCPDVNHPTILPPTRNSCHSYTFTGITPNPNGSTITWDFGDGNTATGASNVPITHVYASAGIYCVTFCVGPPSPNTTNCTGNCAATTVVVPIQAAFNYSLGCNGCLNVNNISTVITSNPSFVTYLWNFGDGNTSSAQNPSQHCYQNPGTYTVTLTITYNDGQVSCTSTAQQTVTYTALTININPVPVCAGSPVTFSSSPGGFITYEWNFGDGFTAYTASSTHIYNAPGNNIPVSLTVMDILGNICSASSLINVLPGVGPCTIQPAYLCPGGSATLSVGSITGATYLWEKETTLNVFVPAPGTNTNNTYSASTPGFYHVVVTGANGCKCISNKVEVKLVSKPKAIIAAAPSSKLCGSGNVMLTSPNHLTGYTSEWYANGNYGSQLSSGQLYFATGISVTTIFNLVLTNEYGCTDTCSLTVTVNPIPTPPVITSNPTLCEGVPITLNVTNYSNNISWNTGATSTSITVFAAGVYTATYTDPATGCSSSSSIKVNRRPPTDLFPHFCNKIECNCRDANGQFTIYAPQPLVGVFATGYNIQWYFNNNPVGTNGPNPVFTPAVNGTYHIVVTDQVTGCKDTSATYTITVPPCDTCDCKKSKWGDIVLTTGDNPLQNLIEANVPANKKLKCKQNYTLLCNQLYTINAAYQCKDTTCPSKVTYSLQPPSGLPITGTVPLSFTPTLTGTYTLTLYGWCGNKICDSCIIDFTVICEPECDCRRSRWGQKLWTTQNVTKTFTCGKIYDAKCNVPITINSNYICPDPACPGTVSYVLVPPVGASTTGSLPLSFTPNQTGTYTLTMYGMCGNKICDSCTIRFKTVCSCCPYDIRVDTSKLTYTYNQQHNATVISQNLIISGLAGVPLTEVRAQVLSYNLTDNYNKECIKCQNFPYTWSSVLSATSIGVAPVPPRITMFNSTVHPFVPTGPGVYQNPREVVWNNGSVFTLPNNSPMGLNLLLPAPPGIDCCELKGKICIKLTFRNDQCKECEVIVCFNFLIRGQRASPD